MNYIRLKEIALFKKGFYGIAASACKFMKGYPEYLRITDISNFSSIPSKLPMSIDVNLYPNWNNFLLKKNDIVFARTGSVGKNYFCESDDRRIVFGGYLIKFSIDNLKIIPKYVSYYCQSKSYWKQLKKFYSASIMNNINEKQYENLLIPLVEINLQQHIINIIGSVDDLIENLVKRNEILFNIGILKINNLNNSQLISLSKVATFKKGIEVGSLNYHNQKEKEMINYIRVSDLLSLGDTYIKNGISHSISKFDDILCAFDGAPGRNSIGLVGAYSSGIYNLVCSKENKGWLYFEINSNLNQKIISNYLNSTTILHASKAIPFLKCRKISEDQREYFNLLFNSILQNKKKINVLKEIKTNLLNKYF